MTSYNNQFRIDLPDGWEDRSVHYLLGPEDGGTQHSLTIVVDRYARGAELAEYARQRIETAVEAIPGAEILKEEEKSLPDGHTVYECVFKWVPSDGKAEFRKIDCMIIDGVGYTFTSNFSKKTVKTIRTVVDQMIASFTPLDEA